MFERSRETKLIPSTNLDDPKTWDAWWLSLRETADTAFVYSHLMALETPEAAYRAAEVAFVADDIPAAHLAGLRALCSPRRVVQLGASAFLAYVESTSLMREVGCTEHRGPPQVLEAVRGTLAAIQALPDRDLFTLEVQARTTVYLGRIHADAMDHLAAANRYGEALVLARLLRLDGLVDLIEAKQFMATISQGRLDASLAQLPAILARPGLLAHRVHDYRFKEAVGLFALGASDQALAVLEAMPPLAVDPDQVPGMAQLLRLLDGCEPAGSAPLDGYIEGHHHRWLRHALLHLARACELRAPGVDRSVFQASLLACLEACRVDDQVCDEEMTQWRAWVRGLCHLWLGQHQLAAQTIGRARLSLEEVLDLRLMLAALKLEVCLSPCELPPEPIQAVLEEIRSVFNVAQRLSHASSLGLARRMQRWHPVAAAFCAVLPEPVEVLLEARAGILSLGVNGQGQAFGLSLPPQVVLETVLCAWGWSAKLFGVRLPNLSEDQVFRRNKLKWRVREALTWRWPVSTTTLVFGMMRLFEATGIESYRITASSLAIEFGLIPEGKSVLTRRELERLHDGLRALIAGRTSIRAFVADVQRLQDFVMC